MHERRPAVEVLIGEDGQLLPLSSSSNAYENVRVVKFGPGILYGFEARSSRSSAQYIQIFDASACPASGAVPDAIYDIAATTTIGIDYGEHGRAFRAGCVIV